MSNLTIRKWIPSALINTYLNEGWTTNGKGRNPAVQEISRTLITAAHSDMTTEAFLRKPSLLQRGKIRRPLGEHEGEPVSQAVNLDYMGAAEFEYGALPLSLRRMQASINLYTLRKVDSITASRESQSFSLWLFGNFDTEEHALQYEWWLMGILDGTVVLQEHSGLEYKWRRPKLQGVPDALPEDVDFWWDIRNDVIMSFDKQFMSRLPGHVAASIKVLNTPGS